MHHTVLSDPRTQNEQDGDALMAIIADIEIAITRETAMAEARIQRIKDQVDEKTQPHKLALRAAMAEMNAYILAHPGRFKRPRARKTTHGEYGLQKAAGKVLVDNQDQVIQRLKENDDTRHFVRVRHTIDKQHLRKHIEAGNIVPGVRLEGGDRPYCKVAKALIEEARQVMA